jgi:hypothetical protein
VDMDEDEDENENENENENEDKRSPQSWEMSERTEMTLAQLDMTPGWSSSSGSGSGSGVDSHSCWCSWS